jgi:proline iminopeptidase
MLPLYFREHEAAERFKASTRGLHCRVAARPAMALHNIDRRPVDHLPDINVPTVIVAGSDDFICAPPKNQLLHHLIAGSKFVVVDKAGHFPWVENPDQFWAGLHSALDSLEVSNP